MIYRFRVLSALALLLVAWPLFAAPRIGLVTMEPGAIFWERFGHNALVVDPGDGSAPISYNYGYFDPDQPDFLSRFIRGQMRYQLAALPLKDDIEAYRASGRGVSVQWLNLTAAQIQSLSQALTTNAQPENANYDYRYFTDNCSTRVRDMLDSALGGLLKNQLAGRSRGNTYRSEAVRLAWPARWMAIGFHLGLSGRADQPLSRWDEAFIPMRLAESMRDVKTTNNQPLVLSEQRWLDSQIAAAPQEMPRLYTASALAGIALAVIILWLGRSTPRLIAAVAGLFWLVTGAAGVTLLYLWLFSEHYFAHANENLLLLSPLAFLALPGALRAAFNRPAGRRFNHYLTLLLLLAGLAAFLKLLPFVPQQNLEWLFLLLPVHWALARHFRLTRPPTK